MDHAVIPMLLWISSQYYDLIEVELALVNSHDKQSFVSMCFGIFAETLPISQQSKRITSSRGVVLVHVLG